MMILFRASTGLPSWDNCLRCCLGGRATDDGGISLHIDVDVLLWTPSYGPLGGLFVSFLLTQKETNYSPQC